VLLAETAFAAGSFDLALSSIATAISLDPRQNLDDFVARYATRATDVGEAQRVLEKTATLRDTAVVHVALAQVALKRGDLTTARIHAKRALELAPTNAEAQQVLRMTGG
jgi:uncharacterized protein HemY